MGTGTAAALVGRAREREELAGVLAAARVRPGGVLVIEGEPGIGKSLLLLELAQIAAGEECVVLSARVGVRGRPALRVVERCGYGEPFRLRPVMPALPEVPWERSRIWIWDCSHFTRDKRVAYAIVDVVTRYWIGYLLTTE
jgi:hypothetical protein